MKARELITSWIAAYNEGNAETLATFYHEEAVNDRISSHTVKGRKAIEQLYEEEFTTARMHCEIEHLHEDTPWVILEWKDTFGLRGCVFFHITDGKIRHQRSYWDTLSYARSYNLPSSIH